MNLQGNGSNHNRRPLGEDENDSFFSFKESSDFERITGEKAPSADGSISFGGEDEQRASKLKQAIEQENSSAYEDLDDFIYRQNKKRHRSSGHHHHRHRSSVDGLSSGSHRRRRSSVTSTHKHKHHYHRHHRRRKMKKWQKVLIGLLLTILIILVVLVGSVIMMIINGRNSLLDTSGMNLDFPDTVVSAENGKFIIHDGVKYQYNENITSILCMGVDKDSFSEIDGNIGTGGDADTLFIMTLDTEKGDTKLINISRDTMSEIGIYSDTGAFVKGKKAQICLAYAYGDGKETSCQNELTAVRRLFYNVPINSYIALDIQGIGAINDSIGGVTVVSPETIGTFKAGETYTLRGSLAMDFVRNRSHSTIEGNNLRMERQKVYLEGFASKLFDMTKSDITAPVNLFNSSSPYTCTNIDSSKIAYLASRVVQGAFNSEFEILTVKGDMKKGKTYNEFYVNEDELFKLFLSVYYIPVGQESTALPNE